MKQKITAALLTTALLAGSCAAYAAGPASTVHADYWKVGLYLDGDVLHQSFANEKGERVYLFSYQGTGYLPLRSAGELMGKEVSWDGTTNTVSISGTSDTKMELTEASDEAEQARLQSDGMEIQLRPDITVVVDGEKKTFTNVKGEPVYPAAWNGSVYLPLRSVGELMGKQVEWIVDPESGAQSVYLSTPLSDGEHASMGAFLDKAIPLAAKLEPLCNGVMSNVYKEKDLEAGEEQLRQVNDILDQLATLPAPETEFGAEWYDLYSRSLTEYQTAIGSGVDQLDKGEDLLELMEDRENGLNSAVQRAWQMLLPILENLKGAYEAL